MKESMFKTLITMTLRKLLIK